MEMQNVWDVPLILDIMIFSILRSSSVLPNFSYVAFSPDNMDVGNFHVPPGFLGCPVFCEYHVFAGLLGTPEIFICRVFPDNMDVGNFRVPLDISDVLFK